MIIIIIIIKHMDESHEIGGKGRARWSASAAVVTRVAKKVNQIASTYGTHLCVCLFVWIQRYREIHLEFEMHWRGRVHMWSDERKLERGRISESTKTQQFNYLCSRGGGDRVERRVAGNRSQVQHSLFLSCFALLYSTTTNASMRCLRPNRWMGKKAMR